MMDLKNLKEYEKSKLLSGCALVGGVAAICLGLILTFGSVGWLMVGGVLLFLSYSYYQLMKKEKSGEGQSQATKVALDETETAGQETRPVQEVRNHHP